MAKAGSGLVGSGGGAKVGGSLPRGTAGEGSAQIFVFVVVLVVEPAVVTPASATATAGGGGARGSCGRRGRRSPAAEADNILKVVHPRIPQRLALVRIGDSPQHLFSLGGHHDPPAAGARFRALSFEHLIFWDRPHSNDGREFYLLVLLVDGFSIGDGAIAGRRGDGDGDVAAVPLIRAAREAAEEAAESALCGGGVGDLRHGLEHPRGRWGHRWGGAHD